MYCHPRIGSRDVAGVSGAGKRLCVMTVDAYKLYRKYLHTPLAIGLGWAIGTWISETYVRWWV